LKQEASVIHRISGGRFRIAAAFMTALALAVSTVGASPTLAQSSGNGITGPGQPSDRASVEVAVTVGSSWQAFSFISPGLPARGCSPADVGAPSCDVGTSATAVGAAPWTFTGAATLTVTDAFSSGDVFQVYDFNTPIGTTSAATAGTSCANVPDTCLANSSISHGTFNLANTSHSITIVPISGGAGVGYFRLTSGTSTGACTLIQTATDSGTTLNLTYTLATNSTATWNVFLVVGSVAAPIIAAPIPAITTPVTFTIPIPNFPSLGTIGLLTTINTSTGIICSDFDLVTT
jgi:hypothetical protein